MRDVTATTRGARSDETEAIYDSFTSEKELAKKHVVEADALIE